MLAAFKSMSEMSNYNVLVVPSSGKNMQLKHSISLFFIQKGMTVRLDNSAAHYTNICCRCRIMMLIYTVLCSKGVEVRMVDEFITFLSLTLEIWIIIPSGNL